MPDLAILILGIIENPTAQKGYRDLKKHFETIGWSNEAAAIDDLITSRFKGENEHCDTHLDKEQQ